MYDCQLGNGSPSSRLSCFTNAMLEYEYHTVPLQMGGSGNTEYALNTVGTVTFSHFLLLPLLHTHLRGESLHR